MTLMTATLALTPVEIRQILEIEERTFPHPWTLADFEWLSQDELGLNLGLWRHESLVGYAIGTVEPTGFHLASLAVDPLYQRQGWGSRLLGAALTRATHRECRSCRLEVRCSNRAALRMYEKFGFAVDGVRRRFYTKPVEDAWLFSRPLPAEPEPHARDLWMSLGEDNG
jgi:[ribosomal protein S18]-alanine N-acetyltransferase